MKILSLLENTTRFNSDDFMMNVKLYRGVSKKWLNPEGRKFVLQHPRPTPRKTLLNSSPINSILQLGKRHISELANLPDRPFSTFVSNSIKHTTLFGDENSQIMTFPQKGSAIGFIVGDANFGFRKDYNKVFVDLMLLTDGEFDNDFYNLTRPRTEQIFTDTLNDLNDKLIDYKDRYAFSDTHVTDQIIHFLRDKVEKGELGVVTSEAEINKLCNEHNQVEFWFSTPYLKKNYDGKID